MNWSEIQCNPAYMLIGSLIDSFIITDSNKSTVNFDKCSKKSQNDNYIKIMKRI